MKAGKLVPDKPLVLVGMGNKCHMLEMRKKSQLHYIPTKNERLEGGHVIQFTS